MFGEPLELARLIRATSDVVVCIDRTKDFGSDLKCSLVVSLLNSAQDETDLNGEGFTEVFESTVTKQRI